MSDTGGGSRDGRLVRCGTVAASLAAAVLLASCSAGPADGPDESPTRGRSSEPSTPPESERGVEGESPTAPEPAPTPPPVSVDDLNRATAVGAVQHLAGRIGPRETTSPAYARAAAWVSRELRAMGYEVERQPVDVPAGVSWWGDPVAAGRSHNLVATTPGFDRTRPHLVVGAHLDTVARAPGAEDNASGVAVMLAVAEAAAQARTRLPVVFVAFGAEEPRGPSDDDHHYGSRRYVALLTPPERRALRAMVSLDRVGVGDRVPVASAGDGDPAQRSLLTAARRAGIPVVAETQQRSSDHWSFVRDGLPAARLGSTSYAAYHSPADVPSVVSGAQLERVGRLVLEWLAPQ
ncbi:M28 family metallopeptidase [Nocardioides sp. SYSU D00065]|uniref:M28 family metallopeptidase n=1 Tax=Nocardioides sp. SYSU D00065 TaxID=2817378 RepID=UPI001B340B00|nr:M28 family peptidase [Nocardioides sp. SYSU D00065]